jgi:hypothetical protein
VPANIGDKKNSTRKENEPCITDEDRPSNQTIYIDVHTVRACLGLFGTNEGKTQEREET